MQKSIFQKYYSREVLFDSFIENQKQAVDVIIPVLNTNEAWEANLHSFFREIPISRLIIGNGGVTDNTLEIVNRFPRVVIVDLPNTSLGYRIAKLIEKVETEFFIYLHSDVYLPQGWFGGMYKHRDMYDWFECNRRITALVEFDSTNQNKEQRALSGSQFGRAAKLKAIASRIDDDYSYRQEDIIFAELVIAEGGTYGRVSETFHYHQLMNKVGAEVPEYKSFSIERKQDVETEKMIWNTQARGIIKYLNPNKKYLIDMVNASLYELNSLDGLDWVEFIKWVENVNPVWRSHVSRRGTLKQITYRNLMRLKGYLATGRA